MFRLKKKMILQPMVNYIVTISTGFFVNIHFVIAIGIAYEKVRLC